jgi:hypothetical protein
VVCGIDLADDVPVRSLPVFSQISGFAGSSRLSGEMCSKGELLPICYSGFLSPETSGHRMVMYYRLLNK